MTTVRRNWSWVRPARWFWRHYLALFHAVEVRGVEHLPSAGPAILAPNHQSFYDGQIIGSLVARQPFYFVVGSYFDIPVVGRFLGNVGCIPLGSGADAYKAGIRVLQEGHVLTVFPEGHRSRDGSLLRLRQGAARLACAHDVPLIPVTIVGAFEAWPRHRWLPRWFRPISLEFHPPLSPDRTIEDVREQARALTAELQKVLEGALAQAKSR